MTASKLLLDAIVATTAALLLAWLASLALRRAPAALRHSVWRLALLAFWVVPPAAIAADALHLQFCPVAVPTPRVVLRERPAVPPASERYPLPSWAGVNRPSDLAARAQPPARRPLPYPSPLTIALIAWGAGVVLSAAYFVAHLRAVADFTRSARPVQDAALSERAAHWSPRVGLSEPPALARSPRLAVPTIVGWRRPLLALPLAFRADDPSCDAVLVHELAHVSRRDLLAHTAARVTRALWWWHPLAWLVDRQLHTSAEEACDDWAVALTGQQHTYADHLVRWAEAATTGGALAYTCGGKALIGRVRRVLAQSRSPQVRPSRRAAALLTICALVAILATAVLRAQPAPVSEPAPREEETVSTPDQSRDVEVLPDELVQLAGNKFADSLGDDFIYQAGLPTAYVQALNHAGIDIDFAEFTALSGWAFSFGYKYDDISTAYLAVRGAPGGDGPYEAFQIAEWFGLGYESARTEEKDELWTFVRKHIDAGTPIISEHFDGGLICGYRETDGKREVWFAADVPNGGPAWVDINDLHPYEVCALVKKGDPLPKRELYVKALQRAVMYATPHDSGGVPQGLAALDAYAADVADPGKDFANCGEYFCWATFERLMARRCAAVWLERAARELDQFFGLGEASARYQHACELYQEYRRAVGGGDPNSGITPEQLRSRQKIAQVVPLLRRAINEERAGLHEIAVGLAGQGIEPPAAASSAAAAGTRQPLREDLFAIFWPLTRAQKAEWTRLLESPSDLRAALKSRSRTYGCTTRERAGSILWLGDDGRVAAMFRIVEDPSDLGAFRSLYQQIQETGSPLTYAFVRLPSSGPGDTDWHIFRLSAVSYLEHCNHFPVAVRDSRPAPALPRADLFGLFDNMDERAERAWAEAFSSPAAAMAARLQHTAEGFGLTQRVHDGFVQWLDRGGEVQVMFRLVPDSRDLSAVRAVYEAIARTACPLTFAVVHQVKDGEGAYDIFRLSTWSYMEHNNRVSGAPPAA